MRIIGWLMALAGLVLTLGPSLLVFAGRLSWNRHAQAMLVGTALWFIGAVLGMRGRSRAAEEEK